MELEEKKLEPTALQKNSNSNGSSNTKAVTVVIGTATAETEESITTTGLTMTKYQDIECTPNQGFGSFALSFHNALHRSDAQQAEEKL